MNLSKKSTVFYFLILLVLSKTSFSNPIIIPLKGERFIVTNKNKEPYVVMKNGGIVKISDVHDKNSNKIVNYHIENSIADRYSRIDHLDNKTIKDLKTMYYQFMSDYELPKGITEYESSKVRSIRKWANYLRQSNVNPEVLQIFSKIALLETINVDVQLNKKLVDLTNKSKNGNKNNLKYETTSFYNTKLSTSFDDYVPYLTSVLSLISGCNDIYNRMVLLDSNIYNQDFFTFESGQYEHFFMKERDFLQYANNAAKNQFDMCSKLCQASYDSQRMAYYTTFGGSVLGGVVTSVGAGIVNPLVGTALFTSTVLIAKGEHERFSHDSKKEYGNCVNGCLKDYMNNTSRDSTEGSGNDVNNTSVRSRKNKTSFENLKPPSSKEVQVEKNFAEESKSVDKTYTSVNEREPEKRLSPVKQVESVKKLDRNENYIVENYSYISRKFDEYKYDLKNEIRACKEYSNSEKIYVKHDRMLPTRIIHLVRSFGEFSYIEKNLRKARNLIRAYKTERARLHCNPDDIGGRCSAYHDKLELELKHLYNYERKYSRILSNNNSYY